MADDLPQKAGMSAFDPHKTRLFHSPGPQAQVSSKPRRQPPPLPVQRPDWHSKTRVLPIEQLLPGLKSMQATRQDTAVLKRHERPKPRLSKQRVYAWAVCLVLWVSVAAASGMPSPAPRHAPAEAVTVRTQVRATERPRPAALLLQRPAPAAQPSAPPTAAAHAAAPAPVRQASTRISPRAAFEAIAAGDTLSASHLYGALAEQHPDNLAYARAARILSQRGQTEAKTRGATP